MCLLHVIGVIFIYKLLDYLIRIPKTTAPTGQRDYILITGCDSGFGNLFAKRLDSKGFRVFAACLTERGKRELEEATSSRLRGFLMDVTNKESILHGYKFVSTSIPTGKGLTCCFIFRVCEPANPLCSHNSISKAPMYLEWAIQGRWSGAAGHWTCSFSNYLSFPGSIQPGCHFGAQKLNKSDLNQFCPTRCP